MKKSEVVLDGKSYTVENTSNAKVSIFSLDENGVPQEIANGDTLWCACNDWFTNSTEESNVSNIVSALVAHLGTELSDDFLLARFQIDSFLDGLTGEEYFKLLRKGQHQYYVRWENNSNAKVC